MILAAWLGSAAPARAAPTASWLGAPTALPPLHEPVQAAPCEPPFGTYGPGAWPPACWRPYAPGSPFADRLPEDPVLAPASAAIVRTLTGWGPPAALRAGIADTPADFDHPIFFSSAGDPVYTVRCTRGWRVPDRTGQVVCDGMRVQIPDAARPAGGADGHMAVVDQRGGWEYDFWQVSGKPRGGGELVVSSAGRTPLTASGGDGLGSDATAARFGLVAGVIRPAELAAGRIEHALFMVVRCDGGAFVYPASGRGAACADGSAPPEGARLQLAMSDAEIDGLGAPPWKEAILRAMARYGAYVGDTGGSPWEVQLESGTSYTAYGRPDPWKAFARAQGIVPDADGVLSLPLGDGVDWAGRLRVIDPCVTRHAC